MAGEPTLPICWANICNTGIVQASVGRFPKIFPYNPINPKTQTEDEPRMNPGYDLPSVTLHFPLLPLFHIGAKIPLNR